MKLIASKTAFFLSFAALLSCDRSSSVLESQAPLYASLTPRIQSRTGANAGASDSVLIEVVAGNKLIDTTFRYADHKGGVNHVPVGAAYSIMVTGFNSVKIAPVTGKDTTVERVKIWMGKDSGTAVAVVDSASAAANAPKVLVDTATPLKLGLANTPAVLAAPGTVTIPTSGTSATQVLRYAIDGEPTQSSALVPSDGQISVARTCRLIVRTFQTLSGTQLGATPETLTVHVSPPSATIDSAVVDSASASAHLHWKPLAGTSSLLYGAADSVTDAVLLKNPKSVTKLTSADFAGLTRGSRYSFGVRTVWGPDSLLSDTGALQRVVVKVPAVLSAVLDTVTWLRLLSVDSGYFSPTFDSSKFAYVDSVSASLTNLKVQAVAISKGARVKINDSLPDSTGSRCVSVSKDTTVRITVENGGVTTTYSIKVWHKSASAVTIDSTYGIPWQTTGVTYGTPITDSRDGHVYKTVVIGSQTWMAQNLNYRNSNGSTDTVGVCYNNSADSCGKYGRLYTWAEVMQGGISSNTSPSGVKGICPTGWHVPSDAEWSVLSNVVGVNVTAQKLQSTLGWGNSGNGTDNYGFRALPGGDGVTSFVNVGLYGNWWTSTQIIAQNDSVNAWMEFIKGGESQMASGSFSPSSFSKGNGFSMRCVANIAATAHDSALSVLTISGGGKLSPDLSTSITSYTDTVENPVGSVTVTGTPADLSDTVSYAVGAGSYSTSSNEVSLTEGAVTTVSIKVTNVNGNSRIYTVNVFRKLPFDSTYGIPWQTTGVTYGTPITDSRDGQVYKTVVIGSQTWMAQNLNYRNSNGSTDTVGVCYNNSTDSCTKYGRLYTWAEAMGLSSAYNTSSWGGNDVGHQGICPTGWHVPSDAEWTMLTDTTLNSGTAGTILKSTSGWSFSGNGTDSLGFRALPAGVAYGGSPYSLGDNASFWSASGNNGTSAWYREIGYSGADVGRHYNNKTNGFSLRCTKD